MFIQLSVYRNDFDLNQNKHFKKQITILSVDHFKKFTLKIKKAPY